MPTINTSFHILQLMFQSRSKNIQKQCAKLDHLTPRFDHRGSAIKKYILKNTLQGTNINHPWNKKKCDPTKTFLGWGYCMCCFPGRLTESPCNWGEHCVDRNIAPGGSSQKHPRVHRRTWQESRLGFEMIACPIHLLLPLHLIVLVFQSGMLLYFSGANIRFQ